MPPVATTTRLASRRPPRQTAPRRAPSSSHRASTRSLASSTPKVLRYFSRAALMSKERSDTGNTRLPRSVFSGTPWSSKKRITSEGSYWEKAL